MASTTKPWPKVMSSHHRNKSCGPCILCQKMQPRYDHFCTLSNGEQGFLQQHYGSAIPSSSCICRSHVVEAKRHRSDPEFIPAWKKSSHTSSHTIIACMYPDCGSPLSERIITPSEGTLPIFATALNVDGSISLCETHYQTIYRETHKSTPCVGCGAKPKAREGAYTRHSPDAITVCQYLSTSTGSNPNILPTDTLCKGCYDMHLVILNHIEQQANEPANRLQTLITIWEETLTDENTDELTRAILATVLFVAKKLHHERALLLPQAVRVFLNSSPPFSEDEYLELSYGKIKFSSRWLLHQLITYLQPFMNLKCVIKRIGTLIYPRNSDPLKCLSLALHDTQPATPMDFLTSEERESSDESVLREAGYIINDLLHSEIRRLEKENTDLTTFNLKESIETTNRSLWDFIESCTRSVRGREGRDNNDDSHTKTIRKFFLICQMLFTTNPSCATTLHNLVADTVEVNGGSDYLIRVLNRLGVSVCDDKHERLITDVADRQKAQPVWNELSPDTFTVASTDNIDFLQSHAAVYCGDQSRSYHATTVQIVQPVPSLKLSHTQPQATEVSNVRAPLLSSETNMSVCPRPVHSKRLLSKSPSNSPHKLGKVGPKRRRTLTISPKKVMEPRPIVTNSVPNLHRNLHIEQFSENDLEKNSKTKLHKEVFAYLLQKLTVQGSYSGKVLRPLRDFLLPTPAQLKDSDPSMIYYMELLDENADSQETMAEVSELVLEKLLSEPQKWVILVGDGKTYEHLQSIKRIYGRAFEQLLIFPGDWHTLKNFQPVIMKAYYHAGLKHIARSSGYKAETLNSLEKCSHFKRTHMFLVQVWEALLTEMISAFVNSNPKYTDLGKSVLDEFDQAERGGSTSPQDLLLAMKHLAQKSLALDEFNSFIAKQAEADDTWHLWSNFVLHDCFSYICLFLAIRTSNWNLRVASLKSMAPLFAAYDRPCYQKLVPNHIADIESYPDQILECFRAGGFSVKIRGGIGHAVALDEAHEMCVNRDLKMAVVRPTYAYLKKTNFFFSYRIKAQKQLESQLFPPTDKPKQMPQLVDTTSTTKNWNNNVLHMRSVIKKHELLTAQSNRGLVNAFTGVKATTEQTHDLLNARKIGEQHYKNYITHHILQVPSNAAPLRKARLLTMAPPKKTKVRVSQKEKEERDTNKYLRRRLAWCNRTGQKFDEGEEQYSLLPRALADPDGNPHKGAKSNWTDKLKGRYSSSNSPPFTSVPPWVPQVAIIDAMFPLNITPLRQHQTIKQYADLLFRLSIAPHFRRGTSEVHLVFDHPERLPFNPKDCEHKRRYGNSKKSNEEHSHVTLTPQSPIPRPWRDYLNCRKCKRSIVEAIGLTYVQTAKGNLRENQVFVLAGCFSGKDQDEAMIIAANELLPRSTSMYKSNSQEADMRVWRHAVQSQHHNILICSADTDVYNIGLVMEQPHKHYVVQINLPNANSMYVDIEKLLLSFRHDPDLASLPQNLLGSIMLQLYIITGCDYISYFSGMGKATFLKIFFQHAEFITSEHSEGCLSQIDTSNANVGFYSCIKLIGTAYFKKNLSTIVSKLGVETPNQLYNSMKPEWSVEMKHKEWYMSIKRAICIVTEDQRPPTLTALWKHWTRSCWIKKMWQNSTLPDQYDSLEPPETQGWLKSDNQYLIDWETAEATQKIQATLDFLSKGCACKTGCKTKRCSCQKKERECGAGCECKGCTNLTLAHSSINMDAIENGDSDDDEAHDETDDEANDDSETDNSSVESDEEFNEIQTEIITDDTFFNDDEEMFL